MQEILVGVCIILLFTNIMLALLVVYLSTRSNRYSHFKKHDSIDNLSDDEVFIHSEPTQNKPSKDLCCFNM